ncbi:MAG: PPOX class F420-dependent oxidoreductase [Dehalococcoidia bacterium]|nr:PPOX class F420-dependent oxidoreductase [Dehalococcoidia bacterium]
MTYQDALPFLQANHNAVVMSRRRSGAAQMSIVTCGVYGAGVAFTTTEGRAKLANLKRDPRCTILVARPDWSRYVVLEGTAEVRSQGSTDPELLRATLRDVYRAASGSDHPDWDEYDRAMVRDRRAAVIVVPERVYGSGAGT